ncbi:alcohol dehydrogenase catalytic domain-containing protein [Frigoribacterium sp. VKM Ac-2836]|uniref:alcohol dehydrogenase catalytic domain-containing protein n=1 Tax=Frigoribacterium sp. VKM Ac-2836 TaxID=2739014 RepID=UPI0015635C9B|nr:alcohol dehydrogenase catalytic domain-containing protein [Frigoribacterium sp. VKM Ac-2836]NRD27528.1 alcohol dehydrogenase catalytic domain-containing protein [Frigoribacterium sp. VKM Ac-2836]
MRPVLDGHDVCLDPPATAQVWLGTGVGGGHGFSEIAVPGVRLARGDALVAVELAAFGPDEVLALVGRGAASLPVVPGGSAVGRVVEADEHARAHDGRRLRTGMRVVWSGTVACGRCVPCHRGLASACVSGERYGGERTRRSWQLSGTIASHVHLRRGTTVVVVAEDVPAAVLAPVAGAIATAAEVLHRASSLLGLSGVPSLAGQVAVVSGAGAAGLVATAMATDAGARVVVVDPEEARRERSRAFGAVALADPRASTGSHALPRVLASVDRSGRHRTVGFAFDGGTGVSALVDQVAVGGVVVLGGAASATGTPAGGRTVSRGRDLVVASGRLVEGLVTLTGTQDAAPERLASAVAWSSDAWQRWPLESLVGRTIPLAEVGGALTGVGAGAGDGLIGVLGGQLGVGQEARLRR